MRKRLVLVVGAIALGGIGVAVPAIAGAVSGNGPAPSSSVTSPVSQAPPEASPPSSHRSEAPNTPRSEAAPPSSHPAEAPNTPRSEAAPPSSQPAEGPPIHTPQAER
jgi:cytoskeletal protein RodZ